MSKWKRRSYSPSREKDRKIEWCSLHAYLEYAISPLRLQQWPGPLNMLTIYFGIETRNEMNVQLVNHFN